MFIDLSRTITNKMAAFKLKNEDGSYTTFEVEIRPFLTREQTKPKFSNEVSFEITQISFQTVVGSYVDSPYHRHAGMADISKLDLNRLIGEAVLIDARGLKEWNSFTPEDMNFDVTNKVVLVNFGWDKYFGTEKYLEYPFISREFLDYLVKRKPKLIGVDTVNIDNSNDLSRPAHTRFLKENIIIVENLVNLEVLQKKVARFYAIPAKFENAASFPVRAFAEIAE